MFQNHPHAVTEIGVWSCCRSAIKFDVLFDLVGDLRCAHPCIGVKPLLAKLREQQPELEAGCKEVREALSALKAQSEAKAASTLPNANEGDHNDARVATPVGVCALSDDALGVVFGGYATCPTRTSS